MQKHEEILEHFWFNPHLFQESLGLDYVWMKAMELPIDPVVCKDRVDLVFMDKFDPYRGNRDATCYVVELKTDKGDHEILGQLKKAVNVFKRKGKVTGHWGDVRGVAVAESYTSTCLELLKQEGYEALLFDGTKMRTVFEREKSKSMISRILSRRTRNEQ